MTLNWGTLGWALRATQDEMCEDDSGYRSSDGEAQIAMGMWSGRMGLP